MINLQPLRGKWRTLKLINVALNGFHKSWEPFVKGICAQEKLPNWEETWEESKANKKRYGEENLAMVSIAKKGYKGNNMEASLVMEEEGLEQA